MIELGNTTLFCLNGIDSEEKHNNSLKAILYSMQNVIFGRILFLTAYTNFKNNFSDIEIQLIEPLTWNTCNDFMTGKLDSYITTNFVLTIQEDGFILDSDKWDSAFLNYDYIGAPWENKPNFGGVRVGNGGFSLRSKKLINMTAQIPKHGNNEDAVICISYGEILKSKGIKFAPPHIAAMFSKELETEFAVYDEDNSFGFHGKHLTRYMEKLNDII